MGRIKNFADWNVPDTLQGCIVYKTAAINQIKKNLNDNRRLEQCERRIEAKTEKESKNGRHTQTENIH